MSHHRPHIILNFHGIGKPPVPIPQDEAPYWISEAEFRRVIEAAAKAARAEAVAFSVTFDDGNASDLGVGAPVLLEHGVSGAFFPCAGRLGKPGYLSAEDLNELAARGFEIGSHGMDHLPWATLESTRLETEAAGSKAVLEGVLGRPVTSLALPFGSYNRRALAAARRAGYDRVYSSDPGLARSTGWLQPRFSYREGRDFDLPQLLAAHARPARRAMLRLKTLVKSRR